MKCRHLPAEDVPRVGHDKGLGSGSTDHGMYPGTGHGADFPRGRGIKCAGDGGLSHFLGFGVTGHGKGVYGK